MLLTQLSACKISLLIWNESMQLLPLGLQISIAVLKVHIGDLVSRVFCNYFYFFDPDVNWLLPAAYNILLLVTGNGKSHMLSCWAVSLALTNCKKVKFMEMNDAGCLALLSWMGSLLYWQDVGGRGGRAVSVPGRLDQTDFFSFSFSECKPALQSD